MYSADVSLALRFILLRQCKDGHQSLLLGLVTFHCTTGVFLMAVIRNKKSSLVHALNVSVAVPFRLVHAFLVCRFCSSKSLPKHKKSNDVKDR